MEREGKRDKKRKIKRERGKDDSEILVIRASAPKREIEKRERERDPISFSYEEKHISNVLTM